MVMKDVVVGIEKIDDKSLCDRCLNRKIVIIGIGINDN